MADFLEILNGNLTPSGFIHLQEKWGANLKRLRQDIEKMRNDMDMSEVFLLLIIDT